MLNMICLFYRNIEKENGFQVELEIFFVPNMCSRSSVPMGALDLEHTKGGPVVPLVCVSWVNIVNTSAPYFWETKVCLDPCLPI